MSIHDGYDYTNQAWVGDDGRYLRCQHPEQMDCQCYGKAHEGEPAVTVTCPRCGMIGLPSATSRHANLGVLCVAS